QSLAFKPDYLVTLRRMVDLAAERQVAPPAALLATAERAAFQDVYVDRLRRYLENAMLAEAGFLAKTAAKLDPILLERCRRVLQEFAGRPES
ncbi:MAG: hypothetical protein HYZ00_10035, partial [Candidatus Hydrogenedentes bacterium]|nr:hypothetical protein [Candidatus Hydrogenedentota bacterium]